MRLPRATTRFSRVVAAFAAALAVFALHGCGPDSTPSPPSPPVASQAPPPPTSRPPAPPTQSPSPGAPQGAPADADRADITQILLIYRDPASGRPMKRTKDEAHALADRLAARARAGENFGRLVLESTDDRDEKGEPFNSGSYSFARGVTPAMPVVERAVFAAKVDEIGEIDTGIAYVVFRRDR